MFFLKIVIPSLTRWKVIGKENIPLNGPLLIVANHLHNIDPPLLSASLPLKIVFMAKQELFDAPLMGRIVRAWGAFPVRRNTGSGKAIRQALGVLGSGQVLGMFPEGRRSQNQNLRQAELGAALIALRAGAPILPVSITGTEKIKGPGFIFRRPKITVTIGQPFSLSKIEGKVSRDQLLETTGIIMQHIAQLLPEKRRGIYGGTQPQGKESVGSVNYAN
jgi:1-acyl-sn-glycerol-3-phosphate acyltransferase